MTNLAIIYWRDIPAQLMFGTGRKAKKYKLPEKYEKAIDHCAMKVGAKDTESYLKYWRKEVINDSGTESASIEEVAQKLELEYSDTRLKALIKNDGWDDRF